MLEILEMHFAVPFSSMVANVLVFAPLSVFISNSMRKDFDLISSSVSPVVSADSSTSAPS